MGHVVTHFGRTGSTALLPDQRASVDLRGMAVVDGNDGHVPDRRDAHGEGAALPAGKLTGVTGNDQTGAGSGGDQRAALDAGPALGRDLDLKGKGLALRQGDLGPQAPQNPEPALIVPISRMSVRCQMVPASRTLFSAPWTGSSRGAMA